MNILNYYGLIASLILVVGAILLAEFFSKRKIITQESTRKLIHIGVSNWWFIFIFMFDNFWMAIIMPVIFIFFNLISYKKNLVKSMGNKKMNRMGTVYYPVSLLLAVIYAFVLDDKIIPGIGILILGYGDGLAAVIGNKYKSKVIVDFKTVYGTLTMFIASFVVSFVMLLIFKNISIPYALLISLVLASFATVFELFSPYGLDNLTVPIGVMAILALFLLPIF